MNIMGYIVVRRLGFVGERFGDAPCDVRNTQGRNIRYRGLSRDPWWDLSGLFYAGKLSEDDKALWKKIDDRVLPFFHVGISEDFAGAERALQLSNEEREINEIVFISSAGEADGGALLSEGSELLGLDHYIDGYGSFIRLGMFTKPAAFPDAIEAVNSNGLFDCHEDLTKYLEVYEKRWRDENLEPLELNRMRGVSLWVYRLR